MRFTTVFPASLFVRIVALLVPGWRREDWTAEWSGEIAHAWRMAERAGESGPLLRVRLAGRSLSSISDALWLRREQPRGGGGWLWTTREVVRSLRRRPGFALSVIFTLALGMGSATAIYTILDGLMLRPLPFRNPEQLVSVSSLNGGGPDLPKDPEAMALWRSRKDLFQDARAHSARSMILVGGDEAIRLRTEIVEPGFLKMLGVSPLLGRSFTSEEATPGEDRVLLLGYEVWRDAFARDASVVGRGVQLDGQPYTVVGVLPPIMRQLPGGVVSAMVPLTPESATQRISLLARLREGVDLEAARERLATATRQLDVDRGRKDGWNVTLMAMGRSMDDTERKGFWMMGGAVLCLLLISCSNAAGLLFLRGVARRPELALRVALGSSRSALVRQCFIESMLLAVSAGALGVALAWFGVPALVAAMRGSLVTFSYTPVGVDTRVLVFAFALTLVTGLLFGVLPAFRTSSVNVSRAGRAATASRGELRMRAAVQTGQLALAVLLLAGAGLFGKSVLTLLEVPLGYDVDRVLTLNLVSLERIRGGPDATYAFTSELDRRLAALPGVEGVARTNGSGISFGYTIELEDGSRHPASGSETLPSTSVDTTYFRVMGIRIAEGRGFQAGDAEPGVGAVVVDRQFAARYWPTGSAVGRRFRIDDGEWKTVVGVTGDVKLAGPEEPYGRMQLFYPATAFALRGGPVVMRASGDPASLLAPVRRAVRELDPAQPIYELETGRQALGESIADPRFLLVILGLFAVVAVTLAAVGVYGLVSFTVAQRTREIGIRMALGAETRRVTADVVGWGFALAVGGIVIGLGAAALLSRFVRALLFEVSPLDPQALGGAALVLLLACAVALLLPALRAARIAPVEALRVE